jgi:hypothetical protein
MDEEVNEYMTGNYQQDEEEEVDQNELERQLKAYDDFTNQGQSY